VERRVETCAPSGRVEPVDELERIVAAGLERHSQAAPCRELHTPAPPVGADQVPCDPVEPPGRAAVARVAEPPPRQPGAGEQLGDEVERVRVDEPGPARPSVGGLGVAVVELAERLGLARGQQLGVASLAHRIPHPLHRARAGCCERRR